MVGHPVSLTYKSNLCGSAVTKRTVEGFVLVKSVDALAVVDALVVVDVLVEVDVLIMDDTLVLDEVLAVDDALVVDVSLGVVVALVEDVVGQVGFNPRAVHDAEPVIVLVPV